MLVTTYLYLTQLNTLMLVTPYLSSTHLTHNAVHTLPVFHTPYS